MDVDLSFFDTIKALWEVMLGFFPSWFQAVVGVALGLFIGFLALALAQKAKDLFWPF